MMLLDTSIEKTQPSQSEFHHTIVQETAKHKDEEGWQRAPARDRISHGNHCQNRDEDVPAV